MSILVAGTDSATTGLRISVRRGSLNPNRRALRETMNQGVTHQRCDLPECWYCQPILCDGYEEPDRHWVETEDGGEIREGRRTTKSNLVQGLRDEVRLWRNNGYPNVSSTTRRLLEHWTATAGTGARHTLFFAQQEAIETLIYLSEVAMPDSGPLRTLQGSAQRYNGGMLRAGCQMATGTGKTMVMACLIAWYAATGQSRVRHLPGRLAQNVEDVVVIAPSLPIVRRLRGLIPSREDNFYDQWNLLPQDMRPRLARMKVTVVNWHKFLPKEDIDFEGVGSRAPKLNERRLAGYDDESEESPKQIFDRVLKQHSRSKGRRLVVINDEAHHCYYKASGKIGGRLIKQNRWMEAVLNLKEWKKLPAVQCIDLTATPHFINPKETVSPLGVQLEEGTPMPWIISRFDLEDAMESGLVKVPQHPTWDDSELAEQDRENWEETVLRNLYKHNRGRNLDTPEGFELVRRGLDLLIKDWNRTRDIWKEERTNQEPVLIIVANTKANATRIYEHIAGTVRANQGKGKSREIRGVSPGNYSELENVPRHGCPPAECFKRTMLVYSSSRGEQGEGEELQGGALGTDLFGPKDRDRMMDILSTVGQPGMPGESVRCVVSVSMLTEGWDCQTVTHILGYRKFGTKLLTEQVLGRALRRADYENREIATGRFKPEFATLFGVPLPSTRSGNGGGGGEPLPLYTVKSVDERADDYRIHFPKFRAYDAVDPGYSVVLDEAKVRHFERLQNVPYEALPEAVVVGGVKPINIEVGRDSGTWRLAGDLVAKLIDQGTTTGQDYPRKATLFSDVLRAVRHWLKMPQVNIDAADLKIQPQRDRAVAHLLASKCLIGIPNETEIVGVPCDEDSPLGHTGEVWFQTRLQNTVAVRRSELDKAACHSKLEVEIASALDRHPLIEAFARNHGPLGWEIPYRWQGGWNRYIPDFVARSRPLRDGRRRHLIIEGKGVHDKRSERKAAWTTDWWIPAVEGRSEPELQGSWQYLEIGSRAKIESRISEALKGSEHG